MALRLSLQIPTSPSQVLLHVLFEHASGYALFAVKEVEEIGMLLPQVRPSAQCSARALDGCPREVWR